MEDARLLHTPQFRLQLTERWECLMNPDKSREDGRGKVSGGRRKEGLAEAILSAQLSVECGVIWENDKTLVSMGSPGHCHRQPKTTQPPPSPSSWCQNTPENSHSWFSFDPSASRAMWKLFLLGHDGNTSAETRPTLQSSVLWGHPGVLGQRHVSGTESSHKGVLHRPG